MKIKLLFVASILFSNTCFALIIQDGEYYQYVENFSGTVTMSGGTIAENLYVKQGSYGEIYDGYIGNFLVVEQTSQASMYGGHVVYGVSSPNQGTFYWYGGVIDGQIRAGWRNQNNPSSHHIIYGNNFKIDGVPVNNITLTSDGGYRDSENAYSYLRKDYFLTGILQDGTQINNNLVIYGDSTITLVPEPATLLLLGLGGLAGIFSKGRR